MQYINYNLQNQPDPLYLAGANLNHAYLYNANLSCANLSGADLSGAKYYKNTKWPDGIYPVAAGAILE